MLIDVIDFAGNVFDAVLKNFFRQLLFVEGNNLFDGANAAAEIIAQGKNLADDNGRTGNGLENAQLPALNALGNFHFAFTREQRNRAHFAKIHADGVIGFFQRARGEVKFNVLTAFFAVKLLIEFGARNLWPLKDINPLRPDGGEQVIKVVGRVNVTG